MNTKTHFDEISDRYDEEIPEHIRQHLLNKKTRAMLDALRVRGMESGSGLDCGCGTGRYLSEMSSNGYSMSGFEFSEGMLDQSIKNNEGSGSTLKLGSITDIPFADANFDFCYTINVLHHLPDKSAQVRAVQEMLRVTKPGGLILLQDFDADNPLVKFYMNFIFPMTSDIDDDETEIWISVDAFRKITFEGGRLHSVDRFTLLPNFLPRFGFDMFRQLEKAAETLTRRSFGAHFLMIYEKSI